MSLGEYHGLKKLKNFGVGFEFVTIEIKNWKFDFVNEVLVEFPRDGPP